MDSGASAHMSYRRDYFSFIEETEGSTVNLDSNQVLKVAGKGTKNSKTYQ